MHTVPQPPLISIITVNWNSRDETVAWLRHLRALDYPRSRVEVIVHDNASGDGSVEAIRAEFGRMAAEGWRALKVLSSDEDLCLCYGLNRAAEAADPASDFLLKLDNDAFPEPGVLRELVRTAGLRPTVAVAGCRIVDAAPPHALFAAAWRQDWWRGTGRWVGSHEVTDADWVNGTALLVRHSVVRQFGFLADPALYIWHEESDLCQRCREAGYEVLYTPHATVYHQAHIGTGRRRRIVNFFTYRNTILFHRRHNHRWYRRASCCAAATLHALKRALVRGEREPLRGAVSGLLGRPFGDAQWRELRRELEPGRQPRILLLAPDVFDKGGIQRYVRSQLRAFRELGTETAVISRRGPVSGGFGPVETVAHGFGEGPAANARFALSALARVLRRQPDVLWCAHLNYLPLALAARALWPALRVAVNVYGVELWSGRTLGTAMLREADIIVSDAHFSSDFTERHLGARRQRVLTIWDSVDTERFRPAPRRPEILRRHGIPEGPDLRYVLTLGRMTADARYKGYDRLLEVLAQLPRNVIALFAGPGDDRLRLQQRARELGLQERAFFLGSVDEAELADVYNLADCFALVSERGPGRGEGVPATPLEACACGKPAIVGDEDGSPEAVEDGVTGLVVSPRHAAELRNALLTMLRDDTAREAMGRAARARMEREFSYPVFLGRMAQALAALRTQQPR
jgi:phosphatidylinositol alpha-1,6-mannosyltransferase